MDNRNFLFMFYGFAAAWAILVFYVITLAVREARLRREVDEVRRMLEESREKSSTRSEGEQAK